MKAAVERVETVKPGRREQQKQEVRSRIHEAATELFSEKGCDPTMVDEICDRAGIARKTFYNYYSSKQELIFDLSESLFYSETSAAIDLSIEKFTSLRERLSYIFQSIRESLSRYESLERTLIQYTLQNISFEDNIAANKLWQVNEAFSRLFVAEPQKSKYSPELLTEMAVGVLISIVLNWVNNPEYDLTGRVDELIKFISCELEP